MREHEKIKISRVVVVEGRYDKIKLDSIIDATIIVCDGFGIFKNKEKQELIRKAARIHGILTATDSDSAGMMIRNFICSIVPKDQIAHVLIPPTLGKERRKDAPSKEGTLGVEGIDANILRRLFEPYADGSSVESDPISKSEFYLDGFSGGVGSAGRRLELARELHLPENLSASALIDAINAMGGRAVYEDAKSRIQGN